MTIGSEWLRWEQLAPRAHPFDAARAERIIGDAVDGATSASDVIRRLNVALIDVYGPWAGGWTGSVAYVPLWQYDPRTPPAEAAVAALDALITWRERLETLEVLFDELRAEPGDEVMRVCAAAARLLPLVVRWTHVEDAWYRAFEVLMSWYLEPIVPPSRARELVELAICGHFSSWVAPREDAAQEAALQIGLAVQRELAEPVQRDALAEWRRTREATQWRRAGPTPKRAPGDGHRRFIETREAARDPERASRMMRALRQARVDAKGRAPLAWRMLQRWQQDVLGGAVPFRDGPAFAHDGAERYGLDDDTFDDFVRCLEEANDDTVPPVARAARVYLDVCFFHPFEDGNARAARLALDFVLSRAGLRLAIADPLFITLKTARDAGGPYAFMNLLHQLVVAP